MAKKNSIKINTNKSSGANKNVKQQPKQQSSSNFNQELKKILLEKLISKIK